MAHRYIGHALCSCPVGWSSSSWYIGILVMPCTCSYSVDIHKFVNRLACRRLSVTSAPGSPCLTLGTWLSVPGSRCLALGAWLSRCLALGAWLSVPGSRCLALSAWLSSSFDAASTPSTSHVHRLVCFCPYSYCISLLIVMDILSALSAFLIYLCPIFAPCIGEGGRGGSASSAWHFIFSFMSRSARPSYLYLRRPSWMCPFRRACLDSPWSAARLSARRHWV